MGDGLPASPTEDPAPLGDFSESWGEVGGKARGTLIVSRKMSSLHASTVRVAAPHVGVPVCQVGPMPGLRRAGSSQAQLMPERRGPLADVLWPVTEDSSWLQTCEGTGRVQKRSGAVKGLSRTPVGEHSDLFSCLSLVLQWDLQPRSSWPGRLCLRKCRATLLFLASGMRRLIGFGFLKRDQL